MKQLSLQEILNKTIWVAKMCGYRLTGTYEQIKKYRDDEECRDFDIVCSAGQPEELRDFYISYEHYGEKHGFITVQDFYKKLYTVV